MRDGLLLQQPVPELSTLREEQLLSTFLTIREKDNP